MKSEDDSVDASYVIKLKPKKEPKRVEIDLQSEVDRLQKELKEKTKQVEELTERTDTVERENKELLAKKPKFGDLRKQAELSKVQQKVSKGFGLLSGTLATPHPPNTDVLRKYYNNL